MSKNKTAYFVAFATALVATPIHATTCAQRDDMVGRLQSGYAEELAVGGLQKTRSAQSVMEIWASEKTGTFTVLLTDANGVSCIVAAGTDFFKATRKPVEKGTAS